MKKLDDIGIVVLSHGRLDKLEKSLISYKENGLLEMVGDNFIFFNEVSSDDISLIERDFKEFEWGGHPLNLGIGWGMIKAIEDVNTEYVLFLENDFELVSDREDIYKQMELGLRNLRKNKVDIIKYRKVKDYINTSNEAKRWVGKKGCEEKNWWIGFAEEENFGYDNSDICEEIDKVDDIILWKMSCRYANWSNNPFLCKVDWFLKLAKLRGFNEMENAPNQRNPDFEEQVGIEGWWQKQDYKVGILPGLFIHQD